MDTLRTHRTSPVVSRYGVQQASWRDIIAVLEQLGGTRKRISAGHNEELFEFPSGAIVKVPSISRRDSDVHSWVFKRLLAQIEATDCELEIFLALLDMRHISWYKTDPFVKHLAVVIKEGSFELQDPDERQRALRVAREHFPVEGGGGDDVVNEPVSYSLYEALVTVTEGNPRLRKRYYDQFKYQYHRDEGELLEQLKTGLLPLGENKLPRLDENAALTLMEYVETEELKRNPELAQAVAEIVPQIVPPLEENQMESRTESLKVQSAPVTAPSLPQQEWDLLGLENKHGGHYDWECLPVNAPALCQVFRLKTPIVPLNRGSRPSRFARRYKARLGAFHSALGLAR